MSSYDRAAYDFGFRLGHASYQLSVATTANSYFLISDALDNAFYAGQSLKSIVYNLDLTPLKNARSDLNSPPYSRAKTYEKVVSLRDGTYYQAINSASNRLASVYFLGANLGLAEAQVSRDPYNRDVWTTIAARNHAINNLVNARSNIYNLNNYHHLNLNPHGPNELLAMFSAGNLNKDIHDRAIAIRVLYGDWVANAGWF